MVQVSTEVGFQMFDGKWSDYFKVDQLVYFGNKLNILGQAVILDDYQVNFSQFFQ